ncbi:MAG: 3-deoxy-D-manno-octulosonic acid transferase, partial [Planctomycetota bacterium]
VQDETYADRFRRLGATADSIHVTGSMKYDGAETDRYNPATRRLAQLAGLANDDVVFLAGSTHEPEEALCLAAYRELRDRWPRLRLVLVPRHPDRLAAVGRMLADSGIAWQRRSELERHGPTPNARILLVDAVGELGAWWGAARVAFVGGSMGRRGGQNMIEPAAYGAAVCFGPNTRNFRDVVEALLARRAAEVVRDGGELTALVERCLESPHEAAEMGRRAQALVSEQLGATERTFDLLADLLERRAPGPPNTHRPPAAARAHVAPPKHHLAGGRRVSKK